MIRKEAKKEKEAEAAQKSTTTEKEKRGRVVQKSTSVVFGDNLRTGASLMNKVILLYHEGKLCGLDHVSVTPNIVSLWSVDLSGP